MHHREWAPDLMLVCGKSHVSATMCVPDPGRPHPHHLPGICRHRKRWLGAAATAADRLVAGGAKPNEGELGEDAGGNFGRPPLGAHTQHQLLRCLSREHP